MRNLWVATICFASVTFAGRLCCESIARQLADHRRLTLASPGRRSAACNYYKW